MFKLKIKMIIAVMFIMGVTAFVGCEKKKDNQSTTSEVIEINTPETKDGTDLDKFFDRSYYSYLENKASTNLSLIFNSNQFINYTNSINSLNDCFISNYLSATRFNQQLANEVYQYISTSQAYLDNGDTSNALKYYSKAYIKLECSSGENIIYNGETYSIPYNSLISQYTLTSTKKALLIEQYPNLGSFTENEFNDLIVFGMLSETINYDSKSQYIPRNCNDARNAAIFSAVVNFAGCSVGLAFGFPIGILTEIACTMNLCYEVNEAQWAYTACMNSK